MMSTELQLALAPARTYRQLVAARREGSWGAALTGPAFTLLAIGVLFSIAAAGRLTIALAATVAVSWSFVVGIQLLAAAVLIASSSRRAVDVTRALELLFLGHAPWSLLLIATSIIMWSLEAMMPDLVLLLMIVVAIAWTAVLLSAFCREVLGTHRSGAWWRTLMHQAIIWGLALEYIAFAAGGWFRILP